MVHAFAMQRVGDPQGTAVDGMGLPVTAESAKYKAYPRSFEAERDLVDGREIVERDDVAAHAELAEIDDLAVSVGRRGGGDHGFPTAARRIASEAHAAGAAAAKPNAGSSARLLPVAQLAGGSDVLAVVGRFGYRRRA